MTKTYYGAAFLLTFITYSSTYGQYAADALRYSEMDLTGSARFQSLGGNHASLGGDPSTIHGNPAGLGFYNRSEFSFSPGVTNIGTKANYLGENVSDSKANFNIPQASLVISSQPGFQRKWKRSSLGISFSRQQSFQDVYKFQGINNRSAYVDKVVQDANANNVSVEQLETDFEPENPETLRPLAYSIPAAYYQMYLINPTTTAGPPYEALDRNSVIDQFGSYSATGANTQWTLAYAGNLNDKFYIGGNVGFSRVRYKYTRYLTDNYIDSPEIIYTDQSEDLSVTGTGINASLGIIYKVTPMFQLGGVIMSPTFTSIRETFSQYTNASFVDGQVTGPDGTLVTPDYTSLEIAPNDFEYSLTGPFRGNLGATFFLQDKGFITGSLEYVGYSGMTARTKYLNSSDNQAFRDNTKSEITDSFRNSVNFRLGAEFRANMLRFRVGGAYIGDPYLDNGGTKGDKLIFTAGLGYRGNRFFADLTGSYASYKTAYTPYVLNNVEDYSSAEISHKPVNVMVTIGTFF